MFNIFLNRFFIVFAEFQQIYLMFNPNKPVHSVKKQKLLRCFVSVHLLEVTAWGSWVM